MFDNKIDLSLALVRSVQLRIHINPQKVLLACTATWRTWGTSSCPASFRGLINFKSQQTHAVLCILYVDSMSTLCRLYVSVAK